MPVTKRKEGHLLTDLALSVMHRELRPVYQVGTARKKGPGGKGQAWDFTTLSGTDNLAQAVIIRLLTPRGELSSLGHPDFGSRVHELIGRENSETNRNLLKLFIVEALKRERRIEKIVELTIITRRAAPSTVDITLTVKPIDFEQTVTIGPFSIEL